MTYSSRLALGASTLLALGACSGGAPADFDTTMSRQQVIKNVIDPAAVALWTRVEMNSTDDGPPFITPKTEEDWAKAEHEAATVAEGGNMLLLPGRGMKLGRADGDWARFSHAMTKKALEVKAATAARDGEKMFKAGGELYQICTDCHQKYYLPYLKPDGSFLAPK